MLVAPQAFSLCAFESLVLAVHHAEPPRLGNPSTGTPLRLPRPVSVPVPVPVVYDKERAGLLRSRFRIALIGEWRAVVGGRCTSVGYRSA